MGVQGREPPSANTERWQSPADCVALLRRRPPMGVRGFESRPFLQVLRVSAAETLCRQDGLWRRLVARLVRDEEAAGSNPVSPTETLIGVPVSASPGSSMAERRPVKPTVEVRVLPWGLMPNVAAWATYRGVAQFGSAPALGAGGRGFNSHRPDNASVATAERCSQASQKTPCWGPALACPQGSEVVQRQEHLAHAYDGRVPTTSDGE